LPTGTALIKKNDTPLRISQTRNDGAHIRVHLIAKSGDVRQLIKRQARLTLIKTSR
jgi:hypothetical protein